MAKFKPCNEDQLVMLPISLQYQLVPGTLESTIHRLVDENIDLSAFDAHYNNDANGAAAIEPMMCIMSASKAAPPVPSGHSVGIVEPVFANICVQKRMHRFTLRSKRKVDVQWRLFALVHNIGKIHSFGALL